MKLKKDVEEAKFQREYTSKGLRKHSILKTNSPTDFQQARPLKNMSLPVHTGHANLMEYLWSRDVRKTTFAFGVFGQTSLKLLMPHLKVKMHLFSCLLHKYGLKLSSTVPSVSLSLGRYWPR